MKNQFRVIIQSKRGWSIPNIAYGYDFVLEAYRKRFYFIHGWNEISKHTLMISSDSNIKPSIVYFNTQEEAKKFILEHPDRLFKQN